MIRFSMMLIGLMAATVPAAAELRLAGIEVVPHVQSERMRYYRKADFSLGARAELFLVNSGSANLTLGPETPVTLRGRTPDELLADDEWSWHDFPSAMAGVKPEGGNDALADAVIDLPPGAMTVWSWNGSRENWGVGTSAELSVDGTPIAISIDPSPVRIIALSFFGPADSLRPDSAIVHIRNESARPVEIGECRLWLPAESGSWRVLNAGPALEYRAFPGDGIIPPGDQGGARIETGPLPLTYGALEVRMRSDDGDSITLFAHQRIRKEVFDISGGWVGSNLGGRGSLTLEPYLKTLRRMHINTGHILETPGYSDNPDLYERYPLKYFGSCRPVARYDRDEILPRVHAVEFLGEPQYGGGKPVAPAEVWRSLAAYQGTRLPTTVTHSEERIWRFYAGLSDYPHYDAYRVSAPSPDTWRLYDHPGGTRIFWGAPLETIGDMTRSLRDLNRPAAIAYWSQGAHDGWGRYGGRTRTSPTPDELRAQAYHALAARITSLYWFNLSAGSLIKFPDLIEPITETGREIRMLEEFYLEGADYHYERVEREGLPRWDLYVIAAPRGALIFALDLGYEADNEEKVFRFGPPRQDELSWPLPSWLRAPGTVLRAEAGGIAPVPHSIREERITIAGEFGAVNTFVVSPDAALGERLEARRMELIVYERSFGFDPTGNAGDLETLRSLKEDKP